METCAEYSLEIKTMLSDKEVGINVNVFKYTELANFGNNRQI